MRRLLFRIERAVLHCAQHASMQRFLGCDQSCRHANHDSHANTAHYERFGCAISNDSTYWTQNGFRKELLNECSGGTDQLAGRKHVQCPMTPAPSRAEPPTLPPAHESDASDADQSPEPDVDPTGAKWRASLRIMLISVAVLIVVAIGSAFACAKVQRQRRQRVIRV